MTQNNSTGVSLGIAVKADMINSY